VGDRRVVRTRVPIDGGRFVFGSGYLVAPQRVLTAKHVLTGYADAPHLGQDCEVRVWPCRLDQAWVPGTVRWLHPTHDVALLTVDGLGQDLAPVEWGMVSGAQPIIWTAVGYPIAALDEDDRVEEEAYGTLAPLTAESKGGLALTVTSRPPREDPGHPSGWEGLSGAAVLTGARLVGIVTADPGGWKDSLIGIRAALIVEPPDLAGHLGAAVALVPVTGQQTTGAPAPQDSGSSPASWLRVKGARVSTDVDFWRDRDQIRAAIRQALFGGPGSKRILSVTGPRGIGKSAIVAKVAAEFERPDPARSGEEDFDALVYASTRTGAGSITLAGLYHSVAGLLDDSSADRLRRLWETSAQAALSDLWEVMRHRRTLIVLDNLDDLQDPATGALRDEGLVAFLESVCATPYPPRVLTTSAVPLGLPAELSRNVLPFPVDEGLGDEDSIALLRSYDAANGFAQFDDDELRQATERLHGVPYGIHLFAQLLQQDPIPMDDMDDLLTSPQTLDELLQQLVPRVFLSLDEPERLVVQLLALSSVPLPDRAVLAILDGLSDADALRAAVRALVRNGGIQFDVKARTLRLHPVGVDWVSNQLLTHDPDQQAALDLRLADWYQGQRLPPSQWRSPEHVTAQRREFHHRWRAGDHDQALVVLAQVARFLIRRGDAASVRKAVEGADAVALGPRGRVAKEQCRFLVEFFTGSSDRAETAARAAADAAEAAGMPEVATEMQAELATVWRHRGESERAIQALLAVTEAGPHVERQVRLGALFELGMAFCYAKRWDEALQAADELAETLEPSDQQKLANPPADIRALARFGAGDYEGALAAAGEAVQLYLDSPKQDNAGYAYNVAGLVWLNRDDLEQAAQQFDEGERLGAEFKVDRLAGMCATNQAWAQLRAGNRDGALAAARRASTLLSGTRAGIAEVSRILEQLLSPETGLDPLTALLQAAASAADNPDVYSPSNETCAAIAATLVAPVAAERTRVRERDAADQPTLHGPLS
jgi:tetratricopeptide (TPR) repeat protein